MGPLRDLGDNYEHAGQRRSVVLIVLLLYPRAFLASRHSDASHVVALLVRVVPQRPFGGEWEQASGDRGRCCCFCSRCTPGFSWLLGSRGASPVGALLVGIVFALPFGGRWAQAVGTRGRWYWLCS